MLPAASSRVPGVQNRAPGPAVHQSLFPLRPGDLANPNITPETAGAYQLMEQNSSGRDFEVTADGNGAIWFIMGTGSGFEGLTTCITTLFLSCWKEW
jgi:hypothetical protein